jgi:hypothetical protein
VNEEVGPGGVLKDRYREVEVSSRSNDRCLVVMPVELSNPFARSGRAGSPKLAGLDLLS